jgi:ethanolamine utilization protein EutP (predicted NTPase)
MGKFNPELLKKEEWIIFTKKDLADQAKIDAVLKAIDTNENRVFIISVNSDEGVKDLRDQLVQKLEGR